RAGVEHDAVADVEIADLRALERARRAVVEADVNAIADDARITVALDVVAGDRAADGAGAGHDRLPGAAAELVAEHPAEHATDNRAGARALRALADGLDARDRADTAAVDGTGRGGSGENGIVGSGRL